MTLLELGLQDGDVLLGHASDEQLVHVLDVTGWEGDALDIPRTMETLEILRAAGPDVCLHWLRSADDPTVLDLFSRLAVVTSDDVPAPGRLDELDLGTPFSLDGLFMIWPRETDHEGFLRWFLTLLFEDHQETYLWICRSLQWILEADVEEEALGMRARRLVEHGFPSPEEAAAAFRPVSEEELAPVRVAHGGPGAEGSGARSAGEAAAIVVAPPELPAGAAFVARCVDRLAEAERLAFRAALDRVSRLVLVAELLDPGKPGDRAAALVRAARTVSIGLEHLSTGDPAIGAIVAAEGTPFDLFRVGATLIGRLHRRAAALRRDGWLGRVADGAGLLDPELRRELEACRWTRPQRFAGVDEDGAPRYEPYATLSELDASRRALETIEALGRLLVDGLGLPPDFAEAIDLEGCLPSSWSEVSAGDLLRTALVHGVVGGSVRFAPLAAGDLAEFARRVFESGRLRASFRAEASEVLLGRLPPAAAAARGTLEPYLDGVLARFEEELGSVDPSRRIDPRFVGGLVRRPAPGG